MNTSQSPGRHRFAAALRTPMAWVALGLLILAVAATAAIAVELYASTSEPMLVNPR